MNVTIDKIANPFHTLAGTGVNSVDQLELITTQGKQGVSSGDTRSLVAVALHLKNKMTLSQLEALSAEASDIGLSNSENTESEIAQKLIMFAVAVYLGIADKLSQFIKVETELHESIEHYDAVYLCDICFEVLCKVLTKEELSKHYYLVTTEWRTGDICGEDRRLYECNAVREPKDLTISKEIQQASWAIAMECNRGTFCGDDSYAIPCFYSDGLITYPSCTRPVTYSVYLTLKECGLAIESPSSISLFDIDLAMAEIEEEVEED
ncbi:hypothetical protein HNW13_017555 [Shewanella sp. BF02_Schw]|uniref:hypothetical protein n=1 Tax=Shewanella sp. BF02_Schw TaxID=394908 RepID=UPI00177E1A84|nr:hypothetical protein [Shewanella sp. BF02_Schw]MBO1897546.1 hypothetical protein [Shewanella sp. BF02_Schw]